MTPKEFRIGCSFISCYKQAKMIGIDLEIGEAGKDQYVIKFSIAGIPFTFDTLEEANMVLRALEAYRRKIDTEIERDH